TNLNPSSGSTSGGNNVILTGTNFTGATDVNFGSSDLTPCPPTPCFTFNNDTQITVDAIPAHGAGGVNVNVVTPNGTTGSLTYTYVTPPPTLTNLSPPSGSTAGGNSVTLTGTNFTGATDVNVGTHDLTACPSAPCFTFNSDTQITVTMPANTPGTINVDVVTPGGTTGGLPYTFVAPGPTVTKVSPNAGAPAGLNTVVLTGTDFEAAGAPIVSTVTVGPTAVTSTPCGTSPTAPCFTVNSATSITIEVLPAGTGMIYITVTTPGGTSAKLASNAYTYVATTPNVLTVSPKYGATAGDAYVTVVGANFGDPSQGFGATDVVFGTGGSAVDIPASNTFPCSGSAGCFEQIGTTIIDVYTPAMAAGTVDISVVTPGGNSNPGIPDQYTFVARGAFTAVNPFRTCDTRAVGSGGLPNQCNTGRSGPVGPLASITVQISGGPVPSGAQAAVVNITAINRSSGATFITAFPAGGSRPVASNINLAGGAVESNLAIVQLSAGGAISIFNSAGSADVIVDVEGYFASSGGGPAGAFHSITPLRICDSRGGTGNPWLCATASHVSSDPLTAGTWRRVVLSGVPGNVPPTTPDIPNDGTAAAAVFNLTATGGSASTFLSVAVPTSGDACPATKPTFSNLNPSAGTTLPNRVISNLGPSQDICLYSNVGTINFIIDVNGWFGAASAASGAFFYSVPPTRICDTRPTFGTRCQGSPLKTNYSEVVHAAGIVAVPAWNMHAQPPPIAVVANLTGIAGSASSYFTLYPSDATSKPTASDLNPSAGQVIANLAVTSLAQTGANVGNLNLYNAVGSINAILDVAGWFQ
ncbi:MAG: IPT/TIG domain-containing protein, partial [Candidatus Dormibacteria bacterium]